MDVLVCCIGKNENRYINEYVNYYKKLGVTKICLFDNNDIDGERFEEKIQKEIDDGFVILMDWRGRKNCQFEAYSYCYDVFKQMYDWFLFIDCGDEYLQLVKHDNICEFLSQEKFNDYDVIHLNLMTMSDNNLLYYEDKPLSERFTEPAPYETCTYYNFPEDYHVSSIVRGKLDKVYILGWNSPHTPSNESLICCDQMGLECANTPFLPYNFSEAYFKHYSTKTIDEYCEKIKRGYPDKPFTLETLQLMITVFFKLNTLTQEKVDIFNEKMKEFNFIY